MRLSSWFVASADSNTLRSKHAKLSGQLQSISKAVAAAEKAAKADQQQWKTVNDQRAKQKATAAAAAAALQQARDAHSSVSAACRELQTDAAGRAQQAKWVTGEAQQPLALLQQPWEARQQGHNQPVNQAIMSEVRGLFVCCCAFRPEHL